MINMKKAKMVLFLLNWESADKKFFKKYKAWMNEDEVIWLVENDSKQNIPYLVYCKSAKNVYSETWVNINNIDELNNCLGMSDE